MSNVQEAVAEAAKNLVGLELTPARAFIVWRAMGHHKSIPFKNYEAIDKLMVVDRAAFDELAAKTTRIMMHYNWSYGTFTRALWHHDPKRQQVSE
jgi:hypothetical protein